MLKPESTPSHDWGPYASGIANNISSELQSKDMERVRRAREAIDLYRFLYSYHEGLGGMVLTRLLARGVINNIFD